AAEYRAGKVSDTAEYRCGERIDADAKAHLVVNRVVVQGIHDAGHAGQRAANKEGGTDDAVDVDTHQARGQGVLGDGPHGFAQTRKFDDERQARQEGDRNTEDQEFAGGKGDVAVAKQVVIRHQRG